MCSGTNEAVQRSLSCSRIGTRTHLGSCSRRHAEWRRSRRGRRGKIVGPYIDGFTDHALDGIAGRRRMPDKSPRYGRRHGWTLPISPSDLFTIPDAQFLQRPRLSREVHSHAKSRAKPLRASREAVRRVCLSPRSGFWFHWNPIAPGCVDVVTIFDRIFGIRGRGRVAPRGKRHGCFRDSAGSRHRRGFRRWPGPASCHRARSAPHSGRGDGRYGQRIAVRAAGRHAGDGVGRAASPARGCCRAAYGPASERNWGIGDFTIWRG